MTLFCRSYALSVLHISVLGPLEVERDGRLVQVPGGKTSELLVHLALEAGLLVRTDRLVEDLWGASAVSTRPNTLQSKIAKLRRALGDPTCGRRAALCPGPIPTQRRCLIGSG